MYKYIFSDLDGTLFDDNKNVSKENISAIKKAQDKGVKFILCSGRAPFYMEDALRQVEQFNDASKYVLSLNGGCITNGKLEVLDGRPMDKSLAKEVFNLGVAEIDLASAVAFEEKYSRFDPGIIPEDKRIQWRWQKLSTPQEILKDIDDGKPYKLMVISLNHNRLEKYKEKIEKRYSNLELVFSSQEFLEINPKGTSKAKGIERFLKLVNGSLDECIAIGDQQNDLDMIEICGLGCCPSNGAPLVKEKADYVCKNDNNHNAIAEIINKFILKEEQ